jgi:dihydroorotate dehydrogenase electron transfer subunit
MKKYILDLTVTENVRLHANYALLKLTSPSLLPEMLPGQFAEIRSPYSMVNIKEAR